MSDDGSESKPRSLLDRTRPRVTPAAEAPMSALEVASAAPPAPAEKPRKARPLSWRKVAKYVAEKTGDFTHVIDVITDIIDDPDTEARDRIKAIEFLSKYVETNPTLQRVQVSGPGGKPIAHAHAHLHAQAGGGGEDVSKLTDEEIARMKAIYRAALKRGGAGDVPQLSAPAGVIDVEVE